WGLGADARSDAAVGRLRAFKGRGDAAPISILVTGVAALAPLGFSVDAAAQRLARDFWPGPLTLVLRCTGAFAPGIARADAAGGGDPARRARRARGRRTADRHELQRERRRRGSHARGGARGVRWRSARARDRGRRRRYGTDGQHGDRHDRAASARAALGGAL